MIRCVSAAVPVRADAWARRRTRAVTILTHTPRHWDASMPHWNHRDDPSLVSVALNSARHDQSDADSKSPVLFMRYDLGKEWKKSNWNQIPTATKFINIKIGNQQGILNRQLRERYWVKKIQKISIHQKDAYESIKPFKIERSKQQKPKDLSENGRRFDFGI